MLNFSYFNPTHVIFGKNRITKINKHIDKNARVLITYGGGSVKKFGTLDEVKQALGQRYVVEFGGIEPNPTYETLIKSLDIIREHKIDFLLAVGGGSVIDGTKFIAAAARTDQDIWQIWSKNIQLKDALPLGCVLTLPATGSETNAHSVVSHDGLKIKLSHSDPLLFPKFAVLDPTKTYTLPVKQTANGVVDAFVHVIEQYLTYPVYNKLQDRYAESILLTLIEEGPKALTDPLNYDVRSTIMWSATQALNGLIGVGVPQDWSTHAIGHQITALYGLDHAETLAVVLPQLMRVKAKNKHIKLRQYAERVWHITEGTEEQRIEKAIQHTEDFFTDLGVKCRLSSYGVPEEGVDKIIDSIVSLNILPLGEHNDLDAVDLRKILSLAY